MYSCLFASPSHGLHRSPILPSPTLTMPTPLLIAPVEPLEASTVIRQLIPATAKKRPAKISPKLLKTHSLSLVAIAPTTTAPIPPALPVPKNAELRTLSSQHQIPLNVHGENKHLSSHDMLNGLCSLNVLWKEGRQRIRRKGQSSTRTRLRSPAKGMFSHYELH